MAFECVLFCLYNCCFPSNSSCTPYFVLFIVMPCSIENFINYNRALPPAHGGCKGMGSHPPTHAVAVRVSMEVIASHDIEVLRTRAHQEVIWPLNEFCFACTTRKQRRP